IAIAVTDANGLSSLPSGSTIFTVYSDPVVTTPTLSAPHVNVGSAVAIVSTTSGGAPPLTYVWNGLPPGCSGSSPIVICTPSHPGDYWVSANVTDGNGITS